MDKFKESFDKYWLILAIFEVIAIPHTILWYKEQLSNHWEKIMNKWVQAILMFIATGFLFLGLFYLIRQAFDKKLIIPSWPWLLAAVLLAIIGLIVVNNKNKAVKNLLQSDDSLQRDKLSQESDFPQYSQNGTDFYATDANGVKRLIGQEELDLIIQRAYRDFLSGETLERKQIMLARWYCDTFPNAQWSSQARDIINPGMSLKRKQTEFNELKRQKIDSDAAMVELDRIRNSKERDDMMNRI